ncbi:MAG: hypothetical protein JST86_09440 [Bacteroidetes bacterium]|nr:hypothetical protein [Bacteroidota bacterium]
MFLYKEGPNNTFDFIAEKHYSELLYMQKLADGEIGYKSSSIRAKLDHLCAAAGPGINFFNDLQANDYMLLKNIIVAKPQELKTIVSKVENQIASGHYPEIIINNGNGETLSVFGKEIKGLFDYTTFTKKTAIWNAYKLAALLGINVCPYCNRNFTFTVRKASDNYARPEFDHFLSKARYPYLALSFYNLIPSCHTCNSNLKHTIEFNFDHYLHPYEHCFDEALRFSVVLRNKEDADLIKEKKILRSCFFLW